MKVKCLTPGGLQCVDGLTDNGEIDCDRIAEVSRRHSRLTLAAEGLNKFGTVIMQEEISDGICRTARAVPAKWQRVN